MRWSKKEKERRRGGRKVGRDGTGGRSVGEE